VQGFGVICDHFQNVSLLQLFQRLSSFRHRHGTVEPQHIKAMCDGRRFTSPSHAPTKPESDLNAWLRFTERS
jgi:hypothetical protein